MVNALKMPEPLASFCVQGEQRIGEQVVAQPVPAVEIGYCRTSRGINDSPFYVDRHSAPVVGRTSVRPRLFRPGFITKFPRMRNRMKTPPERPGMHIERA